MKTFRCLIISSLTVYVLVPTLGYEVRSLYGRTFDLFSFFTSPHHALQNRLIDLTNKHAILQSTIDILGNQFTALQNLVNNLQIQINALQNSIPKCPSAASGGKIISGMCYTVTTIAAGIKFAVAQTACASGGGSLAEPPPTVLGSTAFYSALKSKFPSQFTTIEASDPNAIWIGYIQPYPQPDPPSDPLNGQISGTAVQIVQPAEIWAPNTSFSASNPLAAAIKGTTGNSWTAIDSTTLDAATPKAYVCQYSLI